MSTLDPQKIVEAELLWIIQSQLKLMQDKQFDAWKKQFGLFLDETGIWRCGNADIPYGTKYPILLSKQHFFTTLIVRNAHDSVMHNGVKDTLTEFRAKFLDCEGEELHQVNYTQLCPLPETKPY